MPGPTGATYRWHHVVLEGHRDDIEADHAGDRKVKVLAADDGVDEESDPRVVSPVGRVPHSCHSTHTNEEVEKGRAIQ